MSSRRTSTLRPAASDARARKEFPTLAAIRQWPAVVNIETAGSAFGLSRSATYRAVSEGTFPLTVLTVGHRRVVSTAAIIAVLDVPADVQEVS
jgi:predicted DNA-binding transcriptional regulator AlpA